MVPTNISEFISRRESLMAQMDDNSIAIITGAKEKIRNRDVEYKFRQDSDFYYLTGFEEPDAMLVLIPGRKQGQTILFVRDRDVEMEIWNGYRAGPEGAVEKYKLDDAFPIDDIDEIIVGLIEGKERVYSFMGTDAQFDRQLMDWVKQIRAKVRTGAIPPEDFSDISHLIYEMRLIKSESEIDAMRKAAQISAQAHQLAMTSCTPGMFEYQLDGEIQYHFTMNGSPREAYSSIVGSGVNACVLHYTENRDQINAGDLVLIDAGCEMDYYAADITRTFPASGKFSPEQSAIYQLVLNAQLAAIEAVKPGNNWNTPHEVCVNVLTQGLVALGLLEGEVPILIEEEAYKPFFMHKTGHWLGMDVHDVGDYKVAGQWRVLEPGMALTIEPGIYINPSNTDVDKKWRGIGVRIEDDIVVTKDGCEILSKDVIKEIDDIERLMTSTNTL